MLLVNEMNLTGSLYFSLLLSLVGCFRLESVHDPPACDKVEGKCFGHLSREMGLLATPTPPLETYIVTGEQECASKCLTYPACMLALYLPKSGKIRKIRCHLYSTNSDYNHDPPANQIFLVWKCCNFSKLCNSHAAGRCQGFWLRSNQTRRVMPQAPLSHQGGTQLNESLQRCLSNSLCGSVNFNQHSPSLVGADELNIKWPVSQAENKSQQGWDLYDWLCCHRDDSVNKTCFNVSSKPFPGYWNIKSYNYFPIKSAKYLNQFYTLQVEQCLNECLRDEDCVTSYYSKNSSLCLLEADNSNLPSDSSCADRMDVDDKTQMTSWTWTQCESADPPGTNNDTAVQECLCIIKEDEVTLVSDTCSQPDLQQKRNVVRGMAFSITNRTVRQSDQHWRYLFNGYDFVWLTAHRSSAVKECPIRQCQLYSGSRIPQTTCPRIVPRRLWYAQSATGLEHRFPTVPSVVIVTSTQLPRCPSYTEPCSSDHVRQLQSRDLVGNHTDIISNFLVASDGNMYEGRGWEIQPDLPGTDWNNRTLLITFIGFYQHETPTQVALNALKQFIQCSVAHSRLDRNYTLLAYRDMTATGPTEEPAPGNRLYGVLNNWPRYADYTHSSSAAGCGAHQAWQLWKIVVPGVVGGLLVVGLVAGAIVLIVRRHQLSRLHCLPDCVMLTFHDNEEDRQAFL